MNDVVQIEGVERRFGSVRALHAINLAVQGGEVIGLLGHNGAGKSTLMKIVLGVLAPDAGRVSVLGHDPRGPRARELRMQLGYLPENVSFYDNLSGREVLTYFARLKRVAVHRVDPLLEAVGLGAAADRRVRTYSKGMRQRLGLAQALLGQPRLLLLDEPTVGLDPMAVRDVYAMIDVLRGEGTSVILSSHVLAGIERYLNRVVILRQGQLLAAGTIDALQQQAGLPLRIRVRGEGLNGTLPARLAGPDVGIEDDGAGAIRVSIPSAQKLDVLRTLLAEPGIDDVSIEAPDLETLYAHLDGNHGGGVRA